MSEETKKSDPMLVFIEVCESIAKLDVKHFNQLRLWLGFHNTLEKWTALMIT